MYEWIIFVALFGVAALLGYPTPCMRCTNAKFKEMSFSASNL